MKDSQVEWYERRIIDDQEHFRSMLDDQRRTYQHKIEYLEHMNKALMQPHLDIAALQNQPKPVYVCFKCAESLDLKPAKEG